MNGVMSEDGEDREDWVDRVDSGSVWYSVGAEVIRLEIDLERARRALLQLGSALEEARSIVRLGPDGIVRVKTDDRIIELPVSWAVAGAVAFAVATILSSVPMPSVRRRERERSEEPLGIG